MKSRCSWHNAVLGLCILSLVSAVGCDIRIGDWGRAKYERTVTRSTPLAPDSTLDVDTQFGSVAVTGADVADCEVVAEIVAHAPTKEEAQQLAEQVEIQLQASGNTLKVRADKPDLGRNRSIGVSYTVVVPRQTNVLCHSSYGKIKVASVNGKVTGKTKSGSVNARDIQGDADLDTAYGSIACQRITGRTVTLHSSSGSIEVANVKGELTAETAYGSITCENLSDGDLKLKSKSGKIAVTTASFGQCDVHTAYGSVTCSSLAGDAVKLRSGSGNVDLADAEADSMDLSTSYGRVNARQITTGDLVAESSSGSVDIECSTSAPPDLTANVKSGYGNVSVVAPPNFSGRVHLATAYGSVRTDLPITISGEITQKRLMGKIGDGSGVLRLETKSGSVELK